jgi:hypothetical protein
MISGEMANERALIRNIEKISVRDDRVLRENERLADGILQHTKRQWL